MKDFNHNPLMRNISYYETHATEFYRRTVGVDLSSIQQVFTSLIPAGGRILDAGCGVGRDAVWFARHGFQVLAIDASPAMVDIARSQGVDAQKILFEEMVFDGEFDAVWACASLLHVPHSEISDVLARIHRALKSHGVLYISVKEGVGEGVAEDGRFFSYFSIDEMGALLADHGRFGVVKVWANESPESSGNTRKWLNFLVHKRG
ncbi:MAG: class I SAM-dependent methyltransferase [Nibricoccus sp.]